MKRWRSFERRMRACVARLVNASPELRKQAKDRWQRMKSLWSIVCISWLILFVFMVLLFRRTELQQYLQALSLIQVATSALLAAGICFRLHIRVGEVVMYPITDSEYCRLEWRKGFVGLAILFLFNMVAYAMFLARAVPFLDTLVWAACYALSCALLVFLFILLAVRFKAYVTSSLFGLFFLALICIAAQRPEHGNEIVLPLELILPTGWLNATFDPRLTHPESMATAVGACFFILLPLNIWLYRLQTRHYRIPLADEDLNRKPDPDGTQDMAHAPHSGVGNPPEAADAHHPEYAILFGDGDEDSEMPDIRAELARVNDDFLVYRPGRGWVEWYISHVLNNRDRDMLPCLLLGNYSWSVQWMLGAKIVVLGLTGLLLLPSFLSSYMIFAIALGCLSGMPTLGGTWAAISDAPWCPGVIGMQHLMPVDIRAAARTMLKVTLMRILCWSPVVLPVTTAVFVLCGKTAGTGLTAACACLYILAALQPLFIAGKLTKTTSAMRLSLEAIGHFLFALTVALCALALVLCILLGVFLDPLFLLTSPLLALLSVGAARLEYYLIFRRNRYDLTLIRDE